MSCDFAVWYPSKQLTHKQASLLYEQLCAGDTSGVVSHPSVDAFYNEITSKHPEIDAVPEDQIDDQDLCPWSVAFDRSPGHLIICCVWSKADYVEALVKNLARKHGLAVFDPQNTKITLPGGPAPGAAKSRWKFW